MAEGNPYYIYDTDYWQQPREVCVVFEINSLNCVGDCEIVCSYSCEHEKKWIYRLAIKYGFVVTTREEKGYLIFNIRRKQ